MAPLPQTLDHIVRSLTKSIPNLPISHLSISSLELDRRTTTIPDDTQSVSHKLLPRAAVSTHIPCRGCKAPETFNNKGFFALFAIIAAGMVITALWFFFHAKNGGFHFQEGDWEDLSLIHI